MVSDSALISRVQSGDRRALAVLYERYLPTVWRYVRSRVGDDAACRDVVSETFLALVQGVGRLESEATNVAKWLSGVARRKAADHWRRAAATTVDESAEELAGFDGDPAAAMEASELRREVGEAMARLGDLERTALEWKYIDGLTVREIAERIGRSDKAVEAVLYRARAEFRAQFKRVAQ